MNGEVFGALLTQGVSPSEVLLLTIALFALRWLDRAQKQGDEQEKEVEQQVERRRPQPGAVVAVLIFVALGGILYLLLAIGTRGAGAT